MTWIINRGDRESLYNTATAIAILLQGKTIRLIYEDAGRNLDFENETHAKQAFGYLMEGISRGDRLINL